MAVLRAESLGAEFSPRIHQERLRFLAQKSFPATKQRSHRKAEDQTHNSAVLFNSIHKGDHRRFQIGPRRAAETKDFAPHQREHPFHGILERQGPPVVSFPQKEPF